MAKKTDYLKHGAGYVDVQLSRPTECNGAKIDVLRMREPTVGDQEAAGEMKGSEAAREIATFANLCDLAPDDIRKLPLKDYRRMQEAYLSFLD